MSRASVVDRVTNFAAGVVGNSYFSAIQTGFKDRTTDLATRVSFKVRLDINLFVHHWTSCL